MPNTINPETPATDHGGITRREFAVVAAVASLSASACASAMTVQVIDRAVSITTPDGTADGVLVYPQTGRPSPAIILFPDAKSLRPVKVDMAKRLAADGYAVLVVNQFYRTRKAPVFGPSFSFANPDDRAEMMGMITALDHDKITRDVLAYGAFLDTQPEVDKARPMGAVGYCMGGAMTVRAAAALPDRFAACVSFHGGSMVTDAPTSPHRLVAQTKAAYHIGIAADDDMKEPDAKTAFQAACDTAQRPATIKVYPGTGHGWTVKDNDAYNPEQAEAAWTAMMALFSAHLGVQ
jgi:carboxymethylenebutenolidase